MRDTDVMLERAMFELMTSTLVPLIYGIKWTKLNLDVIGAECESDDMHTSCGNF